MSTSSTTEGDVARSAGHVAPITAVDLNPDESLIATGSYDGRICLWSGEQCRQLFRAEHLVNFVRFSPDGTHLACASADNKAYFIDVSDGALMGIAGPFLDDVNAVVWRPHSRQAAIVTETYDRCVHLWDIDRGEEVIGLQGHSDCVCGAAFSGEGTRLATAGEDGTVRIWELADGGCCVAVLEHPNDPESIDWSPDSRFIVTGCNDGVMRLYSGLDYSLLATSDVADAAVRLVRFADGGRAVLAGSYDAHLRRLAVPDLAVQAVFRSPWQWERSAVAGRSKTVVASFGSAPVVYTRTGEVAADGGRTYGINAMDADVHAGRLRVIVGRDDGVVADALGAGVILRAESIVNGVALSPDGQTVACCDYRGVLRVVALDGSLRLRLQPGGTGPLNTVMWIDADTLATAGYSGELLICGADGSVTRVPAHHGPIKSLGLDPSTGFVFAGSSDHSVSVWNGAERVAHGIDASLSLVNGVASFELGNSFASCSRDGQVRVWDLRSGEVRERLPRAHFRSVKGIDTDRRGRRILTGSYDGRAALWERGQDGWRWRYLDAHGLPGVPAVRVVNDLLVTAGWDGSVVVWSSTGAPERQLDLSSVVE